MKLIIDIDEDVRVAITRMGLLRIPDEMQKKVDRAIQGGTLLPKGHGKIIDADELVKEIKSYISDTSNLHYDDLAEAEAYNSAYCNCLDEIADAPTIIEADREQTDGNNN